MNTFLKFILTGVTGAMILIQGGCESSKTTDDVGYKSNDELVLEIESENVQSNQLERMSILTKEDIHKIHLDGFADVEININGSSSFFRFSKLNSEPNTFELLKELYDFFEFSNDSLSEDLWEIQLKRFIPIEELENVWGRRLLGEQFVYLYTIIDNQVFAGIFLYSENFHTFFQPIAESDESVALNDVEWFLTHSITSAKAPLLEVNIINNTNYELHWGLGYHLFEIQFYDGNDWVTFPSRWNPENSFYHKNFVPIHERQPLTIKPGETFQEVFELQFTNSFEFRPGKYRLISYISSFPSYIRNFEINFEIK